MANRYPAAQPLWTGWSDRMPQRQLVRKLKRQEAYERNACTPHERTRAHREQRCDCAPARKRKAAGHG